MAEEKEEKKLLGKLWDGTKVFEVDGGWVRDHHHIDYVEGGHGLCYKYIPKNEIWVEKMLEPEDESYNLIHECIEYILMKYKIITDYDPAHDATSTIEDMARSVEKGENPDGAAVKKFYRGHIGVA